MTTTISVRQAGPVQSAGHKLKYELVVEFMHGDADGTTYQTVHYTDDEHDEMLLDILGLITSARSYSNINDSEALIAAIYESQGVDEPHVRADKWRDTFYEGDITNEGEAASIENYKLFYYDGDGVKHHVDVLMNGKKV